MTAIISFENEAFVVQRVTHMAIESQVFRDAEKQLENVIE